MHTCTTDTHCDKNTRSSTLKRIYVAEVVVAVLDASFAVCVLLEAVGRPRHSSLRWTIPSHFERFISMPHYIFEMVYVESTRLMQKR